jgi:hypothetical protein
MDDRPNDDGERVDDKSGGEGRVKFFRDESFEEKS